MLRSQELCESRGGRPGLPVSNSPYGFCGRKTTMNLNRCSEPFPATARPCWHTIRLRCSSDGPPHAATRPKRPVYQTLNRHVACHRTDPMWRVFQDDVSKQAMRPQAQLSALRKPAKTARASHLPAQTIAQKAFTWDNITGPGQVQVGAGTNRRTRDTTLQL